MDSFGVISPKLKKLAKTPRIPVLMINSKESESSAVVWQGWQVKNLETLVEHSATGMDSERGVYVITLVKFDSKLRDFLRINDVILKLGGQTVNNLDDLNKAIRQADLSEPLNMIIFRNRKENVISIPENTIEIDNK
jgi:S1-C subfamily serine protease